MIPFCETVPKLELSAISEQRPVTCNYFDPMLTSKGFCYSFNAMPMSDIFRSIDLRDWSSGNLKRDLQKPKGHSSFHLFFTLHLIII